MFFYYVLVLFCVSGYRITKSGRFNRWDSSGQTQIFQVTLPAPSSHFVIFTRSRSTLSSCLHVRSARIALYLSVVPDTSYLMFTWAYQNFCSENLTGIFSLRCATIVFTHFTKGIFGKYKNPLINDFFLFIYFFSNFLIA